MMEIPIRTPTPKNIGVSSLLDLEHSQDDLYDEFLETADVLMLYMYIVAREGKRDLLNAAVTYEHWKRSMTRALSSLPCKEPSLLTFTLPTVD